MKKILSLFMLVFMLAACSPAAPPTATELPAPPATASPPSVTATPLPTLTPTITSTPSPTPSYFVRDGTPVPQPAEAISPENVGRIAELARWGDGQFEHYLPINDEIALSQTVLGVIAFNPDSLDIYWQFEPATGVDAIDYQSSTETLAIGDRAGTIWMLDLYSGDILYRWQAHSASVVALAFAQSADLLVSSSKDDTIAVWTIPETSLVYRLDQTQSGLIDLEVFDGRILFWDRTETIIWRLEDGEMVFKEDGRTLAIFPKASLFAMDSPLSLRQIEDGEIVQSFSKAIGRGNQILPVNSVALSSDHTRFAVGYIFEIRTDVWDVATGDKIYELISPSNEKPPSRSFGDGPGPYLVTGLGFSLDGNSLTAVSGHPDVDYWDMQTGDLIRNADVDSSNGRYSAGSSLSASNLVFSPNGQLLAGGRFVMDVANGVYALADQGLTLLGFSPDGQSIYAYDTKQELLIRVLQTGTLANIRNIFLQRPDGSVCFYCEFTPFPDRRYIAADGSFYAEIDGGYRLWDLIKNAWIPPLDIEIQYPRSLDFSSDGEWLLVAEANGFKLQIIDLETWEVLYNLSSLDNVLWEAKFSLDKQFVVAAANDVAILWRLDEEGTLPHVLIPTEEFSSLEDIAISPTGDLVAAGLYDGQINIWNTSDGEIVVTLDAHREKIYDLTFSPDGRYLASTSSDGTVRLWGIPPVP